MSDLHKTMEAYLSMVSEKKLDPVNKKALNKDFDDREDKDIDNDGDTDSSDEYLHNRRKAVKKAMKKEEVESDKEEEDPKKKKPFPPKKDGEEKDSDDDNYDDDDDDDEDEVESDEEEKPKVVGKKEKDKNPRTSDKTAEISKIGEAFEELWSAMQEAINQKKGATEPEKMDSKASGKEKEFVSKHAVDVKPHDELEKIEEPKERKLKKEMKEFEVIRALLSGNPTGE